MKLDWIEDFLAVVTFRSFSKAAAHRCISQPTLSRRLQNFEKWLGVELIDRSSYPIRLHPIAKHYEQDLRTLLLQTQQLRASMQAQYQGRERFVLITQHSLTMTIVPKVLSLIEQQTDLSIDFTIRSENRDDCVAAFMRRQADVLLCMELETDPLLKSFPAKNRLSLGVETLIPVCAARSEISQQLQQPNSLQAIKLLAFPTDSYLGRVMQPIMTDLMTKHPLDIIHKSVFLAGVKEMVLEGLGMAWLPSALIKNELQRHQLISLEAYLPTKTIDLVMCFPPRHPRNDVLTKLFIALQPLLFDAPFLRQTNS